MVHFKVVAIDGRMSVFALDIANGIKLGIIESTDLVSLNSSSKTCINGNLGGSLNIVY